MRHLFLINPGAGQPGSTDALRRRIAADMAGRDYAVELSRGAGDVERLARQAAETGEAVRIYACGGGGTLNGMHSLIKEFDANLVGMTVLAEGTTSGKRLVDNCTSLVKVDAEDGDHKTISARPGNFMETVFGKEN